MQSPEPGTALASLEDAKRAGNLNVLDVAFSIEKDSEAQSPFLVETVQVIRIIAGVDTYNDYRYANAEKGIHALSGLGLAKIAAAAGLKWVPSQCYVEERSRRPDGHVYIRYHAGAAIRQPNGEWHLELASRDIDTADEEEDLRETKRRQRDAALAANRRAKTDEQIEDEVRRDVLQIRKFLLAHAETKAKNRVIRRILALRQTYTTEELAMPFAVPRLVYRPDIAEANLRLESHGPRDIEPGDTVGAWGERGDVDQAQAASESSGETPAPTNTPALPDGTAGTSSGDVEPTVDNVGEAQREASPEAAVEDSAPVPAQGTDGEDSGGASLTTPPEPDAEPTEAETWRATMTVGPDKPKADPTDSVTSRKFSELVSDETGLERLRVMTESRAPARAQAAQEWLDYAAARAES